ncbi:hypothetical protein CDAR_58481 [Caerostris darwini]|uniref:Uncharacterized protein n=1 Tax=Caerostris darwini TaxID=1538125 RepID=A0AAV4U7L2_9ARAC|nr:hypothetical protein CDAR_58481 [Caerostris darwini]
METEDFIPLGRSAIVAAFPFKGRGEAFIGLYHPPSFIRMEGLHSPLRANNSRRKGVENTFTCCCSNSVFLRAHLTSFCMVWWEILCGVT